MNARLEDKPEHDRQARRRDVDEVLGARGDAGHGDVGAGELADGGRDDLDAQDLERAIGRGVGAAALDREGDDSDGLVGADVDGGGLGELAGGERLVVQLRDRGLDRRSGHILGLDHVMAGTAPPGKAFWTRS